MWHVSRGPLRRHGPGGSAHPRAGRARAKSPRALFPGRRRPGPRHHGGARAAVLASRMARIALALALALLVGGCATDQSRWVPDRSNGQPGWIPCMAGDKLCSR